MKLIISIMAVISAMFLLVKPAIAAAAVGGAVSDCLEVIVPSLFAFTILAILLQKSGLYRVALRPLSLPLSKILRLDEELCAVLVLANIGGYPVGVKLLAELCGQGRISHKDAGRMMCCCFGSGPSFIIGIVGINVFGSTSAGLMLFGVCFAASLIIAAIVRTRGEITLKPAETRFSLNANIFIDSVTASARTLFTVCAMITAFSVITAFLSEIGAIRLFERLFGNPGIFSALLEITRIKEIPFNSSALPICAALLSFGGACVMLQIKALSNGIPMRKFIISRAAAAIISAILALPLSMLVQPSDGLIAVAASPVVPFSLNAVLSLCALAMSAILLTDKA